MNKLKIKAKISMLDESLYIMLKKTGICLILRVIYQLYILRDYHVNFGNFFFRAMNLVFKKFFLSYLHHDSVINCGAHNIVINYADIHCFIHPHNTNSLLIKI